MLQEFFMFSDKKMTTYFRKFIFIKKKRHGIGEYRNDICILWYFCAAKISTFV